MTNYLQYCIFPNTQYACETTNPNEECSNCELALSPIMDCLLCCNCYGSCEPQIEFNICGHYWKSYFPYNFHSAKK